jgi:D-serine deaminase-like pyridoxal phosphate-dependent protein
LNDRLTMHTAAARAEVSSLNKGLGYLEQPTMPVEIASLGWNLLREDVSLPTAVLYEDRVMHNLRWMQQFIGEYGLKLAPHGKTTMTPRLFDLQMRAGAWGITLATAHQTRVAYEHGVRRILMANQLVGKENMAIISRLLQDPTFEYFCLVDSAAQVEQLGQFFAERGQRLQVLIEIGVTGGRTGVRDDEQLETVLYQLGLWPSLALCGIEMYEGVLNEEEAVRSFLQRTVDVSRRVADEGRFKRAPFLLSGAGSAWYDVVADVFAAAGFGQSADIVLRPGCYLTHDSGVYREAQEKIQVRNPIAHRMRSGLRPALEVWAYVQSIPEEEKAIIALGKRDAAFDLGLPLPTIHFRPGWKTPTTAATHWTVTKMMDQHAYLQIARGDDLRVGDMIGFGISHPCLTFDKWRCLLVLDSEYEVVDVMQTFF